MRPLPTRRGSTWRRATALATVVAIAVALLPFQPAPAAAAPALSVTPITFDVIGLDSNSPAAGPQLFPVGARVCNTGDVTLTNTTGTLVFEGPTNPYLSVQGPTVVNLGTLAAGQCRDAYYNVVVQRTAAAYNTVQRYFVQATTDQGVTATTPRPRQLYVETLISQNRNDIQSLTGPTTVYVGETYTYTLVAKTATQGYEQLESFVSLNNVIFQVLGTQATYSSPAGATNDKLYADACGFQHDPTLANYKTCVGPVQYAGGKAGGNVTITYTVKVLSPGTTTLNALIYDFSGSSYHYNSDFADPLTALTVTSLAASADLSVTKTASSSTPAVGQNVTFTVGLANAGPSLAENVQVRDLLPAGLSYVSSVAPTGTTYDPTTGIWAVPSIAATATRTLTITATVTTGAPVTNVAEVVASSAGDPDSTPNNGSITEDDRATVTLAPPAADLSLVKTASTTSPNVGENVTFTVQVTNSGPATPATNVVVRDLLPAGLTYVSSTATSGTYDPVSGSWTVGSVAVGTPRTLTVVATVTARGPITNTAQVQAADQLDPDSTAGNSDPTEDDQSSVTVSPQAADLSLTKVASTTNPNVGQNVTFTVSVTNGGPNGATNLIVSDALPAGLTFVSATPTQGTYDPATGAWFVGGVASGSSANLILVATVTASTPITNTAQVQSVDQSDPDSTPGNSAATEDDQASVVVTPRRADLSLTKTVDVARPNVGQDVTFTISVTNAAASNSSATGVVVRDVLPAGLTFRSASSGTYDSATGLWTAGTIAPGATATLTIVARVATAGAITNTASVQAADQFDPDSTPGNGVAGEDDQSSVAVTPQRADLSLTKSVDAARPNVGDTVVYTVTVANAGPDAATGVSVLDQLPAGLTFVASNAGGAYDPGTGIWVVGTVAAGASATLEVQARVDSPAVATNTARVETVDQFDPDSTPGDETDEDDRSSVVATPQQADLSVTVLAATSGADVRSQTTFTVSVTNTGPDAATGIVVADRLPAGTTLASASVSDGTFDAAAGRWSLTSLPVGATATLTLTVVIDEPGTHTNTAEVVEVDQFDPDSTPANGVPTEDDQGRATVEGLQADLAVTASVDVSRPNVGDTVTFTVTVTNDGPSPASGVAVTDLLPAGFQLASAAPSSGTYAPATGVWSVGTLASGASASLTLTAVVTSPAPAPNVAEITASDRFDPDSQPANGLDEDDRAVVAVAPQVADLSLAGSVDVARPNVGDIVTFTFVLANRGPDAAVDAVVDVVLPAGLVATSGTATQGTYDLATGMWTAGTLAAGGSSTLAVTARVTSPAAGAVVAEVAAVDQFDPDSTPGNAPAVEDDLAEVLFVPQAADLEVTQVASSPTADVGDAVTFTITVHNDGPDGATGVVVSDDLPAGLSHVTSTTGAGTYDPTTGTWTIGPIPSGTSVSLAITATVTAGGPSTNVASVAAADQFDPDSTPGDLAVEDDLAAATVTGLAADLSLAVTAPATVAAAQPVTITITAVNDGPSPALATSVTGSLPATLGSPSTTSPGCVIADAVLSCDLGDLAVGATRVIEITGTAPAAGAVEVTFAVGSSTTDPDLADNEDGAITYVGLRSDLRLEKAAPASVDAGSPLTYDLTVTNDGPSAATQVVITDELPVGLGSPSTSSPGCSIGGVGGRTLTCSYSSLDAGSSVVATVTGTAPGAGPIENTASVATTTDDPDPANNSATASTAIVPLADLSLLKSGPSSVDAGGAISYVIAVANGGPSSAADVVVTDELPAGLGSPTTSSPGCTIGGVSGRTLTCALGTIVSGGTASVGVAGTAPTSGSLDTLANTATVTSSTNDPDPTDDSSTASSAIRPTISISDASTLEGGDATFTVTLSNPSVADVVVDVATADGTATGGDYTGRTFTITIPAGEAQRTFAVSTTADLTDEPDETFGVTLSGVVGAIPADVSGVGTILDDDPTPTVSVSDGSADEGDPVGFTVTLSNPSSVDVTVTVATTSGSATSGTDFAAVTVVVTIPAGELSARVSVLTVEDGTDEPDETFTVTLSRPTAATLGDATGAGTIVDDDGTPTVSISDASADEGDAAGFTVSLSSPSSVDVTVTVATTSGSAISGTDFAAVSVLVTIPAGELSARVSVLTVEDGTDEPEETFTVTLSDPTVATLGDATGAGTIVDDDPTPTVSISDASASEGDAVTFTVSLSNPSSVDVTVTVAATNGSATSDSDFAAVAVVVTIPAGELSAPVSVLTIEDAIDEPDESFTVTLSAPTAATLGEATATGTIVDDDPTPTVSISDASASESDPVTFTVRLSNPSSVDVTVAVTTTGGSATSGTDFTPVSTVVTIPAGELSAPVSVPTIEDGTDEPDETFTVTLSGPTAAVLGDATGAGTIVDDDPTPTVSISDASASEGDSATFTVSLSNPSSVDVTVTATTTGGSATSGTDFTSVSTLVTIPAGELSALAAVPTLEDSTDEPDETFTVTLSGPTAGVLGDSTGAGTIVDDDPTPTVSISDASADEGDAASFTVSLSNPSSVDVTVTVTTTSGSAASGTDFTPVSVVVTIPAGELSAPVAVATLEDVTDEPDEAFTVTLSGPTAAVLGDAAGAGTIVDDDPTPTVSISDASASEGDTAQFTVSLSNPSSVDVTVTVTTTSGSAASGTDFTPVSTVVTIPAGELSAQVPVLTTEDPIDEPDETFTVTLSAPTGAVLGDATGAGTIVDDDGAPMLSISDAVTVEGSPASFTLTLTHPSSSDVVVTLVATDGTAVMPDDFSAPATTVTIPAGTTTLRVDVATVADTVDEVDETFTLTILEATAAEVGDAAGIGNIGDDDNSVVAVDDTATTPEDTVVIIDAVANDTDVDGDARRIVSLTPPPADLGTATIGADGRITFTPAPDTHGTVTFTYVVEDARGATDIGTVTITVLPVNDPPVATPDAYDAPPGAPLAVAAPGVLTNDQDVDGDPLTATLESAPAHGTLTLGPDGSFTYTPAAGFSGTDSFTYRASDGQASSAPVTVTITVPPVPPVAVDDEVVVGRDGAVTIPVLGNDTSAGGPAVGTVTIISGPTKGSATVSSDGTIRYVAAPGGTGSDLLTYRICSPAGLCDEARVRLILPEPELVPVSVPMLPRTGADPAGLVTVALLLVLSGLALLLLVGRRPHALTLRG